MINFLHETILDNKDKVENAMDYETSQINQSLNTQFELCMLYLKVRKNDPYVVEENYTSMLFTAVFKNYISISSAFDLTLQGLYGSARILLRSAFEFLIIAKTIAIRNDNQLLNKWNDGENISLKTEVFGNIISPNSTEIKQFWKALCKYTHATINSQQILFEYEKIENDIKINLVLIKMLLVMNYHVLNTYAANRSIQYYTKFAVDTAGDGLFDSYKREIRQQIDEMRKTLLKDPKRVVFDFSLKWVFK